MRRYAFAALPFAKRVTVCCARLLFLNYSGGRRRLHVIRMQSACRLFYGIVCSATTLQQRFSLVFFAQSLASGGKLTRGIAFVTLPSPGFLGLRIPAFLLFVENVVYYWNMHLIRRRCAVWTTAKGKKNVGGFFFASSFVTPFDPHPGTPSLVIQLVFLVFFIIISPPFSDLNNCALP